MIFTVNPQHALMYGGVFRNLRIILHRVSFEVSCTRDIERVLTVAFEDPVVASAVAVITSLIIAFLIECRPLSGVTFSEPVSLNLQIMHYTKFINMGLLLKFVIRRLARSAAEAVLLF